MLLSRLIVWHITLRVFDEETTMDDSDEEKEEDEEMDLNCRTIVGLDFEANVRPLWHQSIGCLDVKQNLSSFPCNPVCHPYITAELW